MSSSTTVSLLIVFAAHLGTVTVPTFRAPLFSVHLLSSNQSDLISQNNSLGLVRVFCIDAM